MKLFPVLSLALFLVACSQAEVTEPVVVPIIPEMIIPEIVEEVVVIPAEESTEEPVTEPVEEEPAMEPVEEEPAMEPVEEEPTMEPVEEESAEEEPVTETVDEESAEEEPVTETVDEEPEEEETTQTQVFNAQTLAYYDGREGRPAYVAIDGVVYDLSTSSRWTNGYHNGYQAGQDLSRQIPQNHRADMRFERFPIVGTYE